MSTLVKITLSLALILSIVLPFLLFIKGEQNKKRYKKSLAMNLVLFFGILMYCVVLFFQGDAYAATEMTTSGSANGLGYIAAALSIGLSCIGGGLAVSAAASAALGALSEDSSILGKSLIFVGLAEGICLYGLIISFMILGKL